MKRGMIALVLMASVAWTPVARAQGNVKKEITAVYARAMRLLEAKDLEGLAKLMTADMVQLGAGQPPVTRDAWKAQMQQVYPSLSGIKARCEILSVQPKGATVVVNIRQKLTATLAGEGGKKQKLEVDETARDTLVKVKGAWLLKRSETLTQVQKLDGKTPPPPPGAPRKSGAIERS